MHETDGRGQTRTEETETNGLLTANTHIDMKNRPDQKQRTTQKEHHETQ